MELEEIINKLEYLDGERRKQKTAFSAIERRLTLLEESISGLQEEIKDSTNKVSQLTGMTDRFDLVDSSLQSFRQSVNKALEKMEKQSLNREKTIEKLRAGEMESVNKILGEHKKMLSGLKPIKNELKNNIEAQNESANKLEEFTTQISNVIVQNEDNQQRFTNLEEIRKTDSKKLADFLGEAAAIRKRAEEQRGKLDFLAENIQKLDARLDENLANETDRKQAMMSLIDRANLAQVERDREWKDWQSRFAAIDQETKKFDSKAMGLDITLKELKKAQAAFDDVNQRFDRKINELIEMQRITDERFRQEWLNFKADDQKRWTSYSLNQDEKVSDTSQDLEKAADRIAKLEEIIQEIKDSMSAMSEDTQKRLQVLLDLTSDWMDANQRAFGNTK